jgi:hypothetical protein
LLRDAVDAVKQALRTSRQLFVDAIAGSSVELGLSRACNTSADAGSIDQYRTRRTINRLLEDTNTIPQGKPWRTCTMIREDAVLSVE